MKKFVCVILAALLCFGGFSETAFAHITKMDVDERLDEIQYIDDENISGTVYISLSKDGKFVNGVGNKIMAYVPVKLSDLAKEVDLKIYGYENFIFDIVNHDESKEGKQAISLLHLLIYVSEVYGSGWDVEITGGAGSTYLKYGFWGHDENLMYYVNGMFPLKEPLVGATSDQILLVDGDFVDLAMYTDWSFYKDANSGFHYFTDKKADENESNIIHEKTIKQGETAEFYLGRAFGNIDAGETTFMKTESKYPVYYGKELYSKNPESTDTDENGKISITFDEPGEWYVWVDGAEGIDESEGAIVSSPAYAKVTVTGEDIPGDIDGNGKIGNKDVQLLFKYISKIDINYDFDIEKFDVNGDGIVNNKDVIRLFNLSSKS